MPFTLSSFKLFLFAKVNNSQKSTECSTQLKEGLTFTWVEQCVHCKHWFSGVDALTLSFSMHLVGSGERTFDPMVK